MKRTSAPAAGPKTRKPRGRPRSFDRGEALERAMEVFWEKGFEGASLTDLTTAMRINPPSLYAAFGDKETLFLEALDAYQAKRGVSCPYCDEPTARAAVEKLLTFMATELSKACNPRGCMMAMATATSAGASAKMQAAIAKRRAMGRARLEARLEQGVRDGDLPSGTDVEALADFYFTIMSGLSMQARDGASRKSMLATVEAAMRAWPAAATPSRTARRALAA